MDQLDYAQPDFYHFSEDSIILARYVANILAKENKMIHLLDVCAGSGVVGLEISSRVKNISKITYIEIQPEFEIYLQKNNQNFLKDKIHYDIRINDFRDIERIESVQVIVSNPPYYFDTASRSSPNMKKARARNLSLHEFEDLISFFKSFNCPAFFTGPKEWERLMDKYRFKIAEKYQKINIYTF